MKKFTFLMMLAASIFTTQSVMGLTYNVTVPAGTIRAYIAGSFNGWSQAQMEQVDATHFTITYADAIATDEYKYCSGPAWTYEEAINAEGDGLPANRTYEDNNGVDVVAFWKALYVPDPPTTLTINCLVPSAVLDLYITGSFNNWSGVFTDELKMTYVAEQEGGKVFTYQITTDDLNGLRFKFLAGADWAFESETDCTLANAAMHEGNTYNYVISDFKLIYDPALVGYVTINATVPATEEVYVQGSLFGWNFDNAPAMKMTKVDDTHFTYTTTSVYMTFEYRLYNGANWSSPEQEFFQANGQEAPQWNDARNRVATFVASPNNITVCRWTNEDGGTLCEEYPSGIKQVSHDYFTVVSDNGKIVVTNTKNSVEIYDIMGRMVESSKTGGDFTSKTLHTGIYLVRVDGFAEKVLVK
jgi:hypothetical protein